jgi:RNA methyltransferase, TrmH family
MITSLSNPKIQRVRALLAHTKDRREAQAFVVEGVRLAEEAQNANLPVELLLFTEDLVERGRAVVEAMRERGAEIDTVSPQVMRSISDTETPQGILVILRKPTQIPAEQLDFVFIPDEVRDPGNLGSMLRSAAAAGVQAVFLPPGTVDAYSPKVLRAGMGAHFRLPIIELSWQEIKTRVEDNDLQIYLAVNQSGKRYDQADLRCPLALIIGGEANGASLDAERQAEARLQIPMAGSVESLNAAAAAAILLFEVVRQRGNQI